MAGDVKEWWETIPLARLRVSLQGVDEHLKKVASLSVLYGPFVLVRRLQEARDSQSALEVELTLKPAPPLGTKFQLWLTWPPGVVGTGMQPEKVIFQARGFTADDVPVDLHDGGIEGWRSHAHPLSESLVAGRR